MKKLILSLLIFCSAFTSAQISIPQVTGLPATLASKVDKVTGKSLVADTLAAKIQPTVVSVATKEPLLPSTPSNPESRFLNGNKQWAEIVLGSGGYASNVYFTNLTSTIVGAYKQTSGTHELTETISSGTCNNNEVLIHTYLFEQPVGITTVDAGVWRFTMNSKINSSVGDSKFKIVQFKRSSTGVETDMFTIYSNTIENTDYQNFIIETVQPSFLVDSLDRFGCRIYATTTTTVNKTISYKVGDGYASYLNTPLALRHPQLRDPNGNPNVQHLTAAQVTKVNNTSGINTGDETLTSIKTKLGAASSVSDGYLTYNMFNIFNGKEPSFTKNTAFNKNFGTTTGTVLEGRTFGTAANNGSGDFIQAQSVSAQLASYKISGDGVLSKMYSNGYVSLNSSADDDTDGNPWYGIGKKTDLFTNLNGYFGVRIKTSGGSATLSSSGAATFSSTVNSTGFLLNGNNLTSSLSTNYIPKWNGSSMVNSGIYENTYWGTTLSDGVGSFADYAILDRNNSAILYNPSNTKNIVINSSTQSASPTTGALVVNGGIGADHVRANNFYGSGSSLSGVQKPITLTTNGTSGAATFSGNTLNVPNYSSGSTTPQSIDINVGGSGTLQGGSLAGSAYFAQPFRGVSYKKVTIACNALQGTASWTFLTAFVNMPVIVMTDGLAASLVTSKSTTSVTVTCATATTGLLILEGY